MWRLQTGERKKRSSSFSKRLSFIRSKERSGSEDALSGDERTTIITLGHTHPWLTGPQSHRQILTNDGQAAFGMGMCCEKKMMIG